VRFRVEPRCCAINGAKNQSNYKSDENFVHRWLLSPSVSRSAAIPLKISQKKKQKLHAGDASGMIHSPFRGASV
jgi:hypothetical protein